MFISLKVGRHWVAEVQHKQAVSRTVRTGFPGDSVLHPNSLLAQGSSSKDIILLHRVIQLYHILMLFSSQNRLN